MAAVLLHVNPSFYAKLSKNSILSSISKQKNIVRKEYGITHHDAELSFLPNCRYHNLMLVTMKSCYINCTHCVSHINTSIVSIHSSSID